VATLHWNRAVLAATARWTTATTIAAETSLVLDVVQRQIRALISAGKVSARIPQAGHPVRYRARRTIDEGGDRDLG
jgi:hypothetical protein